MNNNQEQGMLGEADFPMGRDAPKVHPKRQLLTQLIHQNAPEYARAPQSEGFHSPSEGRFIRSRGEILTAVIQELMADGGRFVIKKAGVWEERVGFNSETKNIRVLVQERFNRRIRSWKGNLPPLPPLAQPQPVQDTDEDPPGGDNDQGSPQAAPVEVDQPNPAIVPAPGDPIGDDVTEAERSVSSSKFSSVPHSVDMSQDTPDVFLTAILHDLPSDGSSHRGTVQSAPDGSEIDHHRNQGNIEMACAAQESRSASIYDDGPLGADELIAAANLRCDLLSMEDSRKISTGYDNEQDSKARNHSASVGTFSVSNDESSQVTNGTSDSRLRNHNTSGTISSTSIGVFSTSNKGSTQLSGTTGDLLVDGNEKRSRSGDTINSTEPPANKVRLDSASTAERKQTTSVIGLVAHDSPVDIIFDRLSLLDDAPSLNDDSDVVMVPTTRKITEDLCGPQGMEHVDVSGEGSTRSPGDGSNLEITVRYRDMESTGTGLGNVSGLSSETILSALTKPSLSVSAIKELLDDLSDGIINEDRHLMGKSVADRAPRVLSGLMARHTEDNAVLMKAFTFVIQLYASHDSIQVSRPLVVQLMRVLHSHCTDINLLDAGWWLLLILAECDADAIAKEHGVEQICNLMQRQSNDADIQRQACQLLTLLASDNPSNCREIADANGIHVLLQAMRRHEQREQVQEWGCDALGRLIFSMPANPCAIVDANGIDVILQAMRLHKQNSEVQTRGCIALGMLAFQPHRIFQRAIPDANGIAVILQAMRRHEQHKWTQHWGCYALGQLAFRNPENQCAIVDANGIVVILQAMRRHEQDNEVQARGCHVLGRLAFRCPERQCAIADANGIEVVLQAMRRHKPHKWTQHWGCDVLGQLAFRNPENQCAIADANGIVVILQAMRRHEQDNEVQARGCYALGHLVFRCPENQCAIADANGIVVILQAMRRHEQDNEVQARGCYALGQLIYRSPENKCAIADANGIVVILQAIRLHEQNEDVQHLGCYVVGQIAFGNPENQCAIADSNGIGVVLQAMRRH